MNFLLCMIVVIIIIKKEFIPKMSLKGKAS